MSSDLAGSNVVQLTPGDVRASFVGLAEGNGTTVLYYIAAGEIRNVLTLEARDLGTGETTTLASIEPTEHGDLGVGSLSPDGRYVAWSNPDGVDLIDLSTGGERRILTSNYGACGTRPPSECYGYADPVWSPDGRLLLVQETFWEASAAVVVDPFQEAPQVAGQPLFGLWVSPVAWSPDSDAFCAHGDQFQGTDSLYVSQQPEWQARDMLESPEPGSLRYMRDCAWLDQQRIAFVIQTQEVRDRAHEYASAVSIYDLETDAVTPLAELGVSSDAGRPNLFPVPGTSILVVNDSGAGQPGLLDTTDGTRTPILQAGDLVVAVTQPIALPKEIAAATPQVQSCVPLAAPCEAQVTNVSPDRLNIRKEPSQGTDVVATVSEGETVCLTGSSQFGEDGFRWWPVRSQSGVEGWVAHGDPQEPERSWLTPTGRKCETPEEPPHAQSVEVDPPYKAVSEERVLELTLAAQDTPGSAKLMDELELARQAGIEPPPCDDLGFFYSWQVRKPYPPSGINLRFTVGRIGEIFKTASEGASGQEGIRCQILRVDNESAVPVTVEMRYVIATRTSAPSGEASVIWLSWEPRVVRADQVEPVNLTVAVEGDPTAAQIELRGGGSIPMAATSDDTYQVILSPAQVLDGYQSGDAHNVVGFLDLFAGPLRTERTNLIANVRDATMPDVSSRMVDADTQVSEHVVNMRWDSLYLGSQVPPEALRRFYALFPDYFDFVAVVEQVRSVHNRFYVGIRNHIGGIGLDEFDSGATYGSQGRLQGVIHYPNDNFFDLGETHNVHEIGHRWMDYLSLPGFTSSGSHWPISDLAYGMMGYSGVGGQGLVFPFRLVEQAGGDYLLEVTEVAREFNDLELYLMGLIPAAEVGDHFAFQDQEQTDQLRAGGVLKGPVDQIIIDEIIEAVGARVPSSTDAQHEFHLATIVLSKGRLLTGDEVAFFDYMAARGEATTELPFTSGLARGITKPFFLATGGRATLLTSVTSTP